MNHDSDSEIDYEAEEDNNNDNRQDNSDENSEQDSEDETDEDKEDAAWQDEDDKRLKISLTSSNITKKLRTDVDEDIINGVEYTRRLRKQ